jgi:hypothetical protein
MRPARTNRIYSGFSQDVHEQLVQEWKTAQEWAATMPEFRDGVPFDGNTNDQDVFPLQPEWEQGQSISGVFSIAAHSALQYLPDVITQEQTGCAHLWPFSSVISYLPFLPRVPINAAYARISSLAPRQSAKIQPLLACSSETSAELTVLG